MELAVACRIFCFVIVDSNNETINCIGKVLVFLFNAVEMILDTVEPSLNAKKPFVAFVEFLVDHVEAVFESIKPPLDVFELLKNLTHKVFQNRNNFTNVGFSGDGTVTLYKLIIL